MTDKSKRKLVKSLALGSGIMASGVVPRQWSRPVVDSILLPAHGFGSINIPDGIWDGTLIFGSSSRTNDRLLEEFGRLALNTVVPPAHACLGGSIDVRIKVANNYAKLILLTGGDVTLAIVLLQALVVEFLAVNILGQLSDVIAEYDPEQDQWKLEVLGLVACSGNNASGIAYAVHGP